MSEPAALSKDNYRPPADTMHRMEFVYQAIGTGIPAGTACGLAGVKKSDFDWLFKFDEDVHRKVREAQAGAVQGLLDGIKYAGMPKKLKRVTTGGQNGDVETITEIEGDWKALAWILERLDKDNYLIDKTSASPTQLNATLDINALIRETAQSLAKGATIQDAVPSIEAEYTDLNESHEPTTETTTERQRTEADEPAGRGESESDEPEG